MFDFLSSELGFVALGNFVGLVQGGGLSVYVRKGDPRLKPLV